MKRLARKIVDIELDDIKKLMTIMLFSLIWGSLFFGTVYGIDYLRQNIHFWLVFGFIIGILYVIFNSVFYLSILAGFFLYFYNSVLSISLGNPITNGFLEGFIITLLSLSVSIYINDKIKFFG